MNPHTTVRVVLEYLGWSLLAAAFAVLAIAVAVW